MPENLDMCRCPKCGGDMIGNGYTVVFHCEYADDYESLEPDASPKYCNFKEEEVQTEPEGRID